MKRSNNLFAPTRVDKLNDKYFIVDCWHHRIIYTDDFNNEIKEWKMIDYQFCGCHTIATDGELYVIDNTGANEIVVLNSDLKFMQKFINIGNRPHHVIYDVVSRSFYAITGNSQEIFCFTKENNLLQQKYCKKLSFLGNAYIRSISIIDGYMYFPCANGKIYVANYLDESYLIVNTFTIAENFGGLNDIIKTNQYYYITSYGDINFGYNPTFFRVQNLDNLTNNNFEELYDKIGMKGSPYFLSEFDGKIFVTEIENQNGVVSFNYDNEITNIIKNFQHISDEYDIEIRNIFPT
ncbi:hypothetical protein [Clostridium saccharoperbutylacetonicum]|uniref:hypothetical protein n=1 Tax=Clostridium saccharoperbutylacetonicum TaxID=36745 RepID=UPI0039E8A48D